MSTKTSPEKSSAAVDEAQTAILAKGIAALFEPVIKEIDERVTITRRSQVELRNAIETLSEGYSNPEIISDLQSIAANHDAPYDLQPYVVKLNESRKRIAVVSSIMNNTQERLAKLQKSIAKETSRRSSILDPKLPPPPTAAQ